MTCENCGSEMQKDRSAGEYRPWNCPNCYNMTW